jgi:hypothetical protein
MEIKKVGGDIVKFLSVLAGVTAGQLAMSFVPKTNNAIADKLLPGVAGLAGAAFLASQTSDANLKAAATGLGVAGVANLINKFSAGQTGILAKVNQATALPTLQGLGYLGEGNPAQEFLSGLGHLGAGENQLFLS